MIRKTIRSFVFDMIKRGEAVLKKSSLPPGKIMEYRPDDCCSHDGVWTSRDTRTGEEKTVAPEEMGHIVVDGIGVPQDTYEQACIRKATEVPFCWYCGTSENLKDTENGIICKDCIEQVKEIEAAIRKASIGADWAKDAKKDGPIQSNDTKEDE